MGKKVVIDAGHGGTDSGASVNGIIEKDINLIISKYMYDRFKELGVPVKQKELEFYSWEEFEEWKDKFRQGVTQWDCKHEGYVFDSQIF